MPDSGAPLFGLRWVPDEQLRPLRYLPAAYLPGQSRVPAQAGGGGGKGGDDDWWRGATASSSSRAAASPSPSPGPAEASFEVGASSASALKLQQSVRVLTQRLSEAQESVRQKSEQIRWLKEMTKDDASRARVARWMRGPLLRVFLAWKRCVREAALAALDDLRGEVSSAKAREHELQAKGDDLSRDHAVLQAALDHFFDAALANRAKARLRVCWRRWAVTRLVIASAAGGWSGTRGEAVHGLTVRRAMAARRALAALRGNARHAGALRTTTLRLQRRLTWREVRSAFRILKRMQRRAEVHARAVGAAPLTIRQRAALARWRREVTRGRRVRSMCRLLLPGSVRRSLRRSWQLWLVEAWRQQRTLCMAEAQRAQRASTELEAKQRLLASAHANAQVAHATASLWSDDELPAMLESLAQAGAAAAAAAATPANALAVGDAVHGAFAIPTGLSGGAGVADAALAALAGRREAAIAASSWQGTQLKLARWCCSSACKCSPRRSTPLPTGTQLKLTLAVLDSLKRELARERAALASARAEGKQYDQVAEAALTMLQQLREEGSGLHSRLAQLEEAKLRTEQALLKRDAELYESGRAQHSAARALGASLSQIEERTLAQLQRLDARCEARGQQVATLQARVVRATQAARSQRLEAWARQLARPLGDLGQL